MFIMCGAGGIARILIFSFSFEFKALSPDPIMHLRRIIGFGGVSNKNVREMFVLVSKKKKEQIWKNT